MNELEYWEEVVGESFCENGIEYDAQKITAVAKDVSSAHENYGQAFYQPAVSEHPVFAELQQLKDQLEKEKAKVVCKLCRGTGLTGGPVGTSHYSVSTCYKCNGDGRL